MTNSFIKQVLFVLMLAPPMVAGAAVSMKPSTDSGSLQATREALAMPLLERVSTLKSQGDVGYRNLTRIMFDSSIRMEDRWRAVTAVGRVGGAKAKPEIERALKSSEWFMRNAGLVAMMQMDRPQGLVWARQLLGDKALVVRAAAVDAIAQSRDTGSASLLWSQLEAKQNYRRGQSLFIRRRIVEALAEIETAGREPKFIALLGDKDPALHAPAIDALERLTQHSVGSVAMPMGVRKVAWEKWWNESRASR